MAIQWGNNSALAGFQNALALGADIGGAIKQKREDSALSAYMGATTPGGIVPTREQQAASDEAYKRLNQINPRLAYQVKGQMQQEEVARAKAMQEQQANALRVKASQGDPAALQQLVGIDFDSWKTLSADKKKMVADQTAYTGQAALRISQLPPEQQAMAWDQAIEQGVQAGYAGLSDYKGKFSPQALNAAIDNAGLVEKFISLAEPKYMAVPEGGTLINTRNPQAVGAFGAPQAPQAQPAPTMAPEQALRDATARGYVLPDEAAAIMAGLGTNGQAAFQGWLQQNNVKMVTRTGTANGRRVVQFSDGTTQYAD